MRLHAEDDYVLGARRGVISGRPDARHQFLGAVGINEPDALCLQRFEVRAPGDEGHVLAGEREPRPDITADRTDTYDCDLNRSSILNYRLTGELSMPPRSSSRSSTTLVTPWTASAIRCASSKSGCVQT